MSAQHTPGPWNVWSEAPDRCAYIGASADFPRRPIAQIFGRQEDSDEFAVRDANARLIAEAPEMLKALRSIAAITTCADQDPEAMCAEIQGICRVALAAHERGGAK